MMTVWMVWVQSDDHTWLEAAWDDESTAENYDGWTAEVERVKQMCAGEKDYTYRVQKVSVPGVYKLFEHETALAESEPA